LDEIVKQPDMIEEISGAVIQHGPLNRRIYLMKIGTADPRRLASELLCLAEERNYTKIFAKIPASGAPPFISAGFRIEARIPDTLFLGCYLDQTRRIEDNAAELDRVLETVRRQPAAEVNQAGDKTTVRRCVPEDVVTLAAIYGQVFPTYPFPIDDPGYLRETMRAKVVYFGIEKRGELVAVSSSEFDESSRTVEMTDFATLPAWRGHGLARTLLARMDEAAPGCGARLAYTIARALSPGMNIAFSKQGYSYAGRLVNNTNISGKIESMNVWYKKL
jgi:putative beta-lysine N-acetyltransferase